MASRPFASVAVALDVGCDREELLQVRIKSKHTTIHTDSNNHTCVKETCEHLCLFHHLSSGLHLKYL